MIALLLCWMAIGVANYGMTVARFQRRYPELAQDDLTTDRKAWVEVSEGTAPDAIKDRARRVAELFRVEGDGLRAMRERMEQ